MTTPPDSSPSATLEAELAKAKGIADGLQFACRLPDRKPDFTFCGGPAAEAYWDYFTPARTVSLVAALEAVLKLHVRQEKPVRCWDRACEAHRDVCGLAVQPPPENCPDCRFSEMWVCTHCSCPNDEWPCPTYRAIAAAFTSERA